MQCLFLTKDLLFVSRVDSHAKQLGIDLQVSSDASLLDDQDTSRMRLVLVDLALDGLDVAQLISHLRQNLAASAAIVAFGPHVHAEALAAARQAGCDQVLSRGEFNARSSEMLNLYCVA